MIEALHAEWVAQRTQDELAGAFAGVAEPAAGGVPTPVVDEAMQARARQIAFSAFGGW